MANNIHSTGKLEFTESPHEANSFSINVLGHHWLMSILHNGAQLVEVQRANIRRLVACWNACDGIDTDVLDSAAAPGCIKRMVADEVRRITAERDALLAALAEMQDATKVAPEAIATANGKQAC